MSAGEGPVFSTVAARGGVLCVPRDDDADPSQCFPYTADLLRNALVLMCCKSRHAEKMSKQVFAHFEGHRAQGGSGKGREQVFVHRRSSSFGGTIDMRTDAGAQEKSRGGGRATSVSPRDRTCHHEGRHPTPTALDAPPAPSSDSIPPSSHQMDSFPILNGNKSTTDDAFVSSSSCLLSSVSSRPSHMPPIIRRSDLELVVLRKLGDFRYNYAGVLEDFRTACMVIERRLPFIVLLTGTSGTGKSTLASLVASRLGINTIVSTDSVRHVLRSIVDDPILAESTYSAYRTLEQQPSSTDVLSVDRDQSENKLIIQGYKNQSDLMISSLEQMMEECEQRGDTMLIEGVHLTPNFVASLLKRRLPVIPFVICVSNEDKHRERFAIRSKYMTLDPDRNRYIKYFDNIRIIQDYLCRRANKFHIPLLENSNLDRSLAAVHTTIFSSIRQQRRGKPLWDEAANVVAAPFDAWKLVTEGTWRSKEMIEVIRRRRLEGGGKKKRDMNCGNDSSPSVSPTQFGRENRLDLVHLDGGSTTSKDAVRKPTSFTCCADSDEDVIAHFGPHGRDPTSARPSNQDLHSLHNGDSFSGYDSPHTVILQAQAQARAVGATLLNGRSFSNSVRVGSQLQYGSAPEGSDDGETSQHTD